MGPKERGSEKKAPKLPGYCASGLAVRRRHGICYHPNHWERKLERTNQRLVLQIYA